MHAAEVARYSVALVIAMLVSMMIPQVAFADAKADEDSITIETTLQDGIEQKGSRKTIDVIAKKGDKKISSKVYLNAKPIKKAWSDSTKDSYTLDFYEEGENFVMIQAVEDGKVVKEIARTVNYKKAQPGEVIGHATFSMEGLTIGTGYFIEPVQVEIREGENAAHLLTRVLEEYGYSYRNTGKIEDSFYLSMVANGGEYDTGCQEKNTLMSKVPVNLEGKVPACLQKVLDEKGFSLSENNLVGEDGKVVELGEFCYSYLSGWMYSVNNIFPNVGFSGTYPGDGDVIRVQFTLYGLGADIGGGYAMGGGGLTDFYKVANKTDLLRNIGSFNVRANKEELLADAGVKAAYDKALALGAQLDAPQADVDMAIVNLNEALEAYEKIAENKLAAQKVDDMIDALGEITLDSLDDINAAVAAYNALTDEQKAFVKGIDKLDAAIEKYNQLKEEAEKPSKPDPEKPGKPDPEKPSKPDAGKPDASKPNADKTPAGGADKAPETGDENSLLLYVVTLTGALALAFTAKRKYSK